MFGDAGPRRAVRFGWASCQTIPTKRTCRALRREGPAEEGGMPRCYGVGMNQVAVLGGVRGALALSFS